MHPFFPSSTLRTTFAAAALALLAGWAPLQEAFPEIADPPPEPEDVF